MNYLIVNLSQLKMKDFDVPEAIFQPSFFGINSVGFHETTYNFIIKCEIGLH
jgi:hypothetical protein